MSTWEGYAVECKFGTHAILAQDVQRTVAPRVSQFDTPGMDAAITTYHGRKGYEDRVTALIPAGEYKADLAHTSVNFRIDHLGMSHYTARFTGIDARRRIECAST